MDKATELTLSQIAMENLNLRLAVNTLEVQKAELEKKIKELEEKGKES